MSAIITIDTNGSEVRRYSNSKRFEIVSFDSNIYQATRPIRVKASISSSWVYSTFKRRECIKFVPSPMGDLLKCICGRSRKNHNHIDDLSHQLNSEWTPAKDTVELPTDAAGTLEFQGTGEGDKAQFIKLSDTTPYSNLKKLLSTEWELQLPKLIITVHGGEKHLDLTARQKSIIGSGLIRATRTTEAWIMSIGLHSGVGELVGSALHDHQLMRRGRIRAVGVAPWGIVDNREDLVFNDVKPAGPIPYQTMADPLSKGSVLNACHSHFLLVDNGTENKWGNELKFRRNLENSLVRKDRIPMVCLIVEGDKTTIETVKEKVNNNIPVVICAGTGSNRVFDYGQARNAADLIAYAYSHTDEHGLIPKEVRTELRRNIQQWLQCKPDEENAILLSINQLIRKKKIIKIYRLDLPSSEPSRSFDHAILTAIFNSKHKPDPDKWLKMAMSWDRADIARSQIFAFPHGQDFPVGSLERRLEEALVNNRVEFVNLLMENGVSMHKFLTYKRLQDLYNQPDKSDYLPQHLAYLFQDITKGKHPVEKYTLIHVGQVVELLMGGTYRCHYTRKRFRLYYEVTDITTQSKTFDNPFHELFIWAVLMKRQEMAIFMWQKGEEALAKALVAMKMFKRMAQEAEDDDMNQEEIQNLRNSAENFKGKALEILKLGYKESEKMCYQLLTYELKSWSRHTCLSLAILAQHRDLIAHPCVQNILSDLMMGGLDLRRHSNIKVPLSLLCLPLFAFVHILPSPFNYPSINFIKFKTHEQLLKQPQTIKEFLEEYEEFDPGMTTRFNETSTSSDISSSSDDNQEHFTKVNDRNSLIEKKSPKFSSNQVQISHNVTFHEESTKTRVDTTSLASVRIVPTKKGDLDFYRKSYEYLNAPITKFWSNLFFYIAFLVCFSYVILLKTPPLYIPAPEYFIIIYILTFTIENVRSMILSTPCSVWAKIKNWHSKFWNFVETLAILIFLIGFILRSTAMFKNLESDATEHTVGYGRALYCLDVAIWLTRIFKFCSVNKTLGPYVTMAGKMMLDMGSFITLLVVVLVSFGVCRQAILVNHHTEWNWSIISNITMEPYFMLYGEVYAPTIDPCTPENSERGMCVPGAWFVPVMMTFYLLVANILLLNLLIAVFNYTFARTKQESSQIWACQRYEVIMQYEAHPLFPPPLIIFSHLKILIDKFIRSKKFKTVGQFSPDRGLKLFLNEEEEEVLHDWEEELVDDYYRLKRSEDGQGFEEQMRSAAERIPKMERHLEEVELRNTHLRNTIWDISARIMRMEEAGIKFFEHLEIRSRKPSMEETDGTDPEMNRHPGRRPSFIPSEEASNDLYNHLNKWKEGKKLERIRRDSEFREEESRKFQPRSFSNCSNKDMENLVRTSASSISDDDSGDVYNTKRAQSCAELVSKKSFPIMTRVQKSTLRRPSLPITIGFGYTPKRVFYTPKELSPETDLITENTNKDSPHSVNSFTSSHKSVKLRKTRTTFSSTSDSNDSILSDLAAQPNNVTSKFKTYEMRSNSPCLLVISKPVEKVRTVELARKKRRRKRDLIQRAWEDEQSEFDEGKHGTGYRRSAEDSE